ncbi:hypothetical protein LL06_13055 [Hoeflea sp. BAL378]|nr:hypothetical protein LL06_13055 [Hoeflea sp. BAL378]
MGDFNRRPARTVPMHGDHSWQAYPWYDAPHDDPAFPEVHVYTDAMSYDAGDEIAFHASSTAATWSMTIYRDGADPVTVMEEHDIKGVHHPVPEASFRDGCGWPVAFRWTLPDDSQSGFYRVVSTCDRPSGGRFVQHHCFVVRPSDRRPRSQMLLILPTSTWIAYNDWGGANYYFGAAGPEKDKHSPVLSTQRPWTRGMVWLPPGAPRICADPTPEMGDAPRYPMKEFAYANGFGQFYAAAGWAQFDRHFVVWAEREGYTLDIITQSDLHFQPELLDHYSCVVIVGHDEYWTREMRLTMEAYVEKGGNLARFGANFLWQVRLENNGTQQVCYKFTAAEEDPVRNTDQAHTLTTAWEDKSIAWPGATTVGVNGMHGMCVSWGGFAPGGQKGFTVYRPEHWAFEGTGLHYADVFGEKARIFAYEVDGLDYTFRHGFPYPVPGPGIPESIEILAMAPALLMEDEPVGEGFRYYVRDFQHRGLVKAATGGHAQADLDRYAHGSGMMVHMTLGRGEVLTAATCEWVMGLKRDDPYTQMITRNILDRFIAKGASTATDRAGQAPR